MARVGAGGPPPRRGARLADRLALALATFGIAVLTLRAAVLSARYDPGLSPAWRRAMDGANAALRLVGAGDGFSSSSPARTPGSRRRLLPGVRRAPGDALGRANDLSDAQWSSFRRNAPALVLVALCAVPAVALARRALGPARMPAFHAVYAAAFAFALHGDRAVFPAAMALAHFALCRAVAGVPRLGALATWTSALACLVAARALAERWTPPFGVFGAALASFPGVLPRWWVHFNLVVLRMISFGVDLHRRRAGLEHARERRAPEPEKGAAVEKGTDDESVSKTKTTEPEPERASGSNEGRSAPPTHHTHRGAPPGSSAHYASLVHAPTREVEYSLSEYVAYVFYPPLYVAGPISSFNAFASQLRRPTPVSSRAALRYAFRKLGLVWLLLEVWTRTQYANAFAKARAWRWEVPAEERFGTLEVCAIAVATMNFMWLKFAVIWRFFRLWAMASGQECPENMLRCVNNSPSVLEFWKSWHHSFNRWLVRYVYVPLGGSGRKRVAVPLTFAFVGAWHDALDSRLVWWAAIFAVAAAPESALAALAARGAGRRTARYEVARAVAGGVNTCVLIVGNMVGYVVGAEGARELGATMLGDFFGGGGEGGGRGSALGAAAGVAVTFVAFAHFGFVQREREKEKADAEARGGEGGKGGGRSPPRGTDTGE